MYDCIVIGAGLSGLSAAQELVKRGHHIKVLEARDRVGGRIENTYLKDGELLELGGQLINRSDDAVIGLAEELNLDLIQRDLKEDYIIRRNGNSYRLPVASSISDLTPLELMDLGQGFSRFQQLVFRMKHNISWVEANQSWLQQKFTAWIKTNLRTLAARKRFEGIFATAYGIVGKNESLLAVLDRTSTEIDLESLVVVNGELKQFLVKDGMFAICERMAKKLKKYIQLNSVVTKIVQKTDLVEVILCDGTRFEARRAIVTLPPWLLPEVDFQPALEEWRNEVIGRVGKANFIKAFLIFNTRWWKKEGLSGKIVSDEGALRIILDLSNENSDKGILMGLFKGEKALKLSTQDVMARKAAFLESVKLAFRHIPDETCEYVERNWTEEHFTGGNSGAYFLPGAWTSNGPKLAKPCGLVSFAGAEYSSQFNGYLEGAIRSGRKVAASIFSALN